MYDYHHVCITHGGTEARSSVHDVAVGLIEAACASLARASTFQIQHSTFKIPVSFHSYLHNIMRTVLSTRALTAETLGTLSQQKRSPVVETPARKGSRRRLVWNRPQTLSGKLAFWLSRNARTSAKSCNAPRRRRGGEMPRECGTAEERAVACRSKAEKGQ